MSRRLFAVFVHALAWVRTCPTRMLAWLQTRPALVAAGEQGQTTAEYALVILGAAAVATLLVAWATKSHALGKLFDAVIGKVMP
jgi:uncharacterized protein DUF4244